MNRRDLLAASITSVLLGTGGCVDRLDSVLRHTGASDGADPDFPDCAQKDAWGDDITSGPTAPDPESIAGRFECSNADRPEPTGDVCRSFEIEQEQGEQRTYHSVGVSAYPNPPENYSTETLLSFVSEYEQAFMQNTAVSEHGDRLVSAGFRTYEDETRVLDLYEEITVVWLLFGSALTIVEPDSGLSYVDNFSDAVVYGIDNTGVVRADATASDDDPPDPVMVGSLLECF